MVHSFFHPTLVMVKLNKSDIQDNPDIQYLIFASDLYVLDAVSESFVIPDHSYFYDRLSKAVEDYVLKQ